MAQTHPTGYILIVDDDADIRFALRLFFEGEGYGVAEAQHGGVALDYLRQTSHRCVVLLDINMPQVSGITVLQTVQADAALYQRHAYCVMTAQDATLPIALARLMGTMPIRLIGKPFDLIHLLSVVTAAQARLTQP